VIKKWVRVCLLGLVSLVWAGGATAVTNVFRCVKDGQTVLTDKPCDAASSTSSPADTASGSESKRSNDHGVAAGSDRGLGTRGASARLAPA